MRCLLSGGFSVTECGLLKSPAVTTELTIVSFSSVCICFIYCEALMFGAHMLVTVLYFGELTFYHYIMSFFVSYDGF